LSGLDKFKYLWKADDKDWLQARKAEWEQLRKTGYAECDAQEIKLYSHFYVYGEQKAYMDTITRFILTPFTTAVEASELFELITSPGEKTNVLGSFMRMVSSKAQNMPWLRDKTCCFIDGVLGDEYKLIKVMNGRREETISPVPGFFAYVYAIDV